MIARPGFTGGALDRADRLRHDPEAFAAARSDWRARLLKLENFEPELDGEGRMAWTNLADAPEGSDLLLLGLDGDTPCFAALTPGMLPPVGRISPRSIRSDVVFPAPLGPR